MELSIGKFYRANEKGDVLHCITVVETSLGRFSVIERATVPGIPEICSDDHWDDIKLKEVSKATWQRAVDGDTVEPPKKGGPIIYADLGLVEAWTKEELLGKVRTFEFAGDKEDIECKIVDVFPNGDRWEGTLELVDPEKDTDRVVLYWKSKNKKKKK